jgi:hypothetical protein
MTFISVVLPEPLGPISSEREDLATFRLTPSNALNPPNVLVTPFTANIISAIPPLSLEEGYKK